MPEYIERGAVLEKAVPVKGCFSNMISAWDVINLPAADVVSAVHGYLGNIKVDEAYCEMGDCSVCGCWNPLPANYCRICGAKMDMK